MKLKIAVIRGTGFVNLDGSLVTISNVGDGTTSVVPYGSKDAVPIVLDSRCIQEVDDTKKFRYSITILKAELIDNVYQPIDAVKLDIDDALRNVSLETITEYLNSHLKPLLTME